MAEERVTIKLSALKSLKAKNTELIRRGIEIQQELTKTRAELDERMARANQNFAAVCHERDQARLGVEGLYPSLVTERDLYKKLYEDLLEKVVRRPKVTR
jgi:predicted type IV restriction endonuclease